MITAFFAGAIDVVVVGNPGPTWWGWLVEGPAGRRLDSGVRSGGEGTTPVAELKGLIGCLQALADLPAEPARVAGDNQPVLALASGGLQTDKPNLVGLVREVRELLRDLAESGRPVDLVAVDRRENKARRILRRRMENVP